MGFGWSSAVHAEGSRNLINNGGYRPFLDFRSDDNPAGSTGNIPRRTTIKVYAAAGETINLASSAMAYGLMRGAGDIQFRAPNGTTGTCSTVAPGTGFIPDLNAEVNGLYTPCTIPVEAGQTGVWEINFVSPNPTNPLDPPATGVNEPWIQISNDPNVSPPSYVAAWDVTVQNSGGAVIPGRAYANYLALNMGNSGITLNSNTFILTDQGYLYQVSLNGLDPFGFIFFANSKGFVTQPCPPGGGNPIYRSIPINPPPNVCSPALSDNASQNDITYKIFFNPPSQDLPLQDQPVPGGGFTWLRKIPAPIPTVADLSFQGVDGTPGQAGPTLGGNFSFNATSPGYYSIVIDVNRNGVFGDGNDRILQDFINDVNSGPITVGWDGTDSNGSPLPAGFTPYVSQLSFYVGDVHFPFLDPENNNNNGSGGGLIIQRLNPTSLTFENDRVYYNDAGLPLIGNPTNPISALNGVSSSGGAHRFGNGTITGFGNENGIDTWTSLVDPIILTGGILIQKADLSIDKTDSPDPVVAGSAITYTLAVTSNPPTPPDVYSNVVGARVTDTVPPEITGVSWSCAITSGIGACGTASGTGNDINLTVDLNVGATATITVNGTVSSSASGTLTNTANVTRPPDVFDPNLTNNTDNENTTITPNPVQPVGTKSARLSTDADGSGSVTPGDIIEYTVTYTNQTPGTDITDFVATDSLESNALSFVPGSYSLTTSGVQTTITANPNFNGTTDTNLNTAGTLGRAGGQVVIKYQAVITAAPGTEISNQARATSNGGTVPLSLTDAVQGSGDLPQIGDDGIDSGNLPGTDDDEPTLIRVEPPIFSPVQPVGTKSARLSTDADGSGSVTPGDIIEYTVTYTNQTPGTDITDFVATDSLESNALSFVPGSYSLTTSGVQTTITANPNFNGTTNTNLNTAGTLGRAGGQVVIKYQAVITAAPGTEISNQARATSNGGTVPLSLTDAVQGSGDLPQIGDDGIDSGNLPGTDDDEPTLIRVEPPVLSPVQPVGTKSARLSTDADGSGSVTPGDIIEYSVTYTNQTPGTDITDFVATDSLESNALSFVPGSYSLSAVGTQTTVTANPNFNGTTDINLNTAGTLGRAGGQVVIKYQAVITAAPGTQISNQARATSNGGTVDLSLTDAVQGSGNLPQIGDDGIDSGNLPGTDDDEPTLITVSASGSPRLRLVKRITNVTRGGVTITGINFSNFVDDPNDDNDTAAGWSQLSTGAPVGVVKLGSEAALQSGDEVEYTVYFLSDGSQTSQNIKFCDAIPTATTFIADTFGSGRGILLNRGGTQTPQTNDASDTDAGAFFSPLTAVTVPPCSDSNNPNGAVFLQMGDIPNAAPSNIGLIRFWVRID